MKKKISLRYVLLAFLCILGLIQFIRPEKNINSRTFPGDISHVVRISDTVLQILHIACYDCHSNNTNYNWYHEIMPVGYWLNHHVKEGKRELNFSEFGNYSTQKKDHKLAEIEEEVRDHEMPLASYTSFHKEAKLSEEQILLLIDWAKHTRMELKK